jgi:hypothetical protein
MCSDRQPVPDHQEAFLTPSGPFAAKLIFEITAPIDSRDRVHPGDNDPNLGAVNYYMDDLTDVTNDTWKNVEGPRRVAFELPSMHQYAAYYLETEITDRKSPTKGHFHDNIPGELPQPHSWFHLLLVRVPRHESEFVVQLIVKNGHLSALTNSRIAKQIMNHVFKTLNFKNFKALIPTPPGNTEQEAAMATGDAEEME